MSYINYRDWIYTQLSTITGLKIFKEPTNNTSEYPCVEIIASDSDEATFQDNRRYRRGYTFSLVVSMSISEEHQDIDGGETAFLTLLDQIIEVFDDPTRRHTNLTEDIVSPVGAFKIRTTVDAGGTFRIATADISIARINE